MLGQFSDGHSSIKIKTASASELMRYLTLSEVLDLHRLIIKQSGGAPGLRDLGTVKSAVAQPQMTFGGDELYSTID